MNNFPPESFERQMACSEADWLRWLPAAIGAWPSRPHDGGVCVSLDAGQLLLRWQVQAPRCIGRITLPVLRVRFDFAGVDAPLRQAFMQRFDLYMQRGGG